MNLPVKTATSHYKHNIATFLILHQLLMKIYIAYTLAIQIAAAAAEAAQHNIVSDNHNVSCTSREVALVRITE